MLNSLLQAADDGRAVFVSLEKNTGKKINHNRADYGNGIDLRSNV
jgi:hypothetical protein